jgi:hypothetical protein
MVGSADTGIKRVGLNRGAAGTYGYGDFMNAQGCRGWLLLTERNNPVPIQSRKGPMSAVAELRRRTLDVIVGRRGYTRASKLWGTKGRKIM